ncbi:oligoendopeptidase F [Clostridium sp. WB02_MRS01]|uniref:oligoendopeptidase F n=1 Tax=Clostridium sp. WB02_MRS01 TaxID=2605777 RepID=UPI0012B3708A|nr:oligoendopeptidase F [Clostridium sp. WB02_MRS01]MSS11574.1 oligoendopeptidase F [Clostridium sp. WB02_MRS01]
MKKREEIPVCDTWNLADILPSESAWEDLFRETERSLSGYKRYEGHLADSGEMLFSCLKFDEELSLKIETLFVYGKQKSDENTGNARYQEFSSRARSLSYEAAGLSSFLIPEILAIPEETLDRYRKNTTGLTRYDRTLEIILKKKAHTLSASMEALLAKSMEATSAPSEIFNMFNNADVKFPEIVDEKNQPVKITHGNYVALMEKQDRRVRKSAFEALYSVYGQFSNTLAATFSSNVKQAAFYAKARNYPSARAHSLGENEIPEEVYDNLLKAVHEELPSLHGYVSIRKKALGVDELHMYDLYVPMVSREERKYTFEEAKSMVLEGLKPLGEDYLSLLREGFTNRWIDVYENEGKRSGAYSWGVYGIHPYVLLNFNGTLDSVFTLAHEMGHALHSWFSDKNQTYIDAGYKIFVAEVASTCNEALLVRHLLETTSDKKERAYLVNHFMDSFRGTLYRQAMFAEFEAETHRRAGEGEVLTAEVLCKIYHRLNEEYFGPDMVVDQEIDYEWSRIPHFYTPFYVYQYATGFSAAIAISSRILKGDENAVKGYFEFLSGGNSMTPIDLLKLCGVDMGTAEPVKDALQVFAGLLEEMSQLI